MNPNSKPQRKHRAHLRAIATASRHYDMEPNEVSDIREMIQKSKSSFVARFGKLRIHKAMTHLGFVFAAYDRSLQAITFFLPRANGLQISRNMRRGNRGKKRGQMLLPYASVTQKLVDEGELIPAPEAKKLPPPRVVTMATESMVLDPTIAEIADRYAHLSDDELLAEMARELQEEDDKNNAGMAHDELLGAEMADTQAKILTVRAEIEVVTNTRNLEIKCHWEHLESLYKRLDELEEDERILEDLMNDEAKGGATSAQAQSV
jgi:hypothetical protein